nr:MAG TPA: hypothetical protein [Bacteriophage sp.]
MEVVQNLVKTNCLTRWFYKKQDIRSIRMLLT